jgi:hypothetical protein
MRRSGKTPGQKKIARKQGAEKRLLNKKEVKTDSFSPPGVGGVLHDNL